MKRFVAMLLVIIIAIGCMTAYADDEKRYVTAQSMIEYIKSVLTYMKMIYDYLPSQFDDGYVLATYHYYNACRELKYTVMAEMANESGGLISADGQKLIEESTELLDSVLRDEFYRWVKGEETQMDFVELLMNMVDVTLKGGSSTESE